MIVRYPAFGRGIGTIRASGSPGSERDPDQSNVLAVGVESLWEVGIKVAVAKLKLAKPFRDWLDKTVADFTDAGAKDPVRLTDHPAVDYKKESRTTPLMQAFVSHRRSATWPIGGSFYNDNGRVIAQQPSRGVP